MRTFHKRAAVRFVAGLASASVLVFTGTLWATDAHADVVSGCQTDPWGFLGSQQRNICDGALRPDGSWLRARSITVPAHYVPITTSCYGSYFVSCTTTGGYPVAERTVEAGTTYIVTPDTIVPGEPGHLVNGNN